MKKKPIKQYTTGGKYMRTWESSADIVTSLGLKTHANIVSCCNLKPASNTAHGFMWRYEDGDHSDIEPAVKRGSTFKSKHGVDSEGHKDVMSKRKATNLERYGVDHPMQSDIVKLTYKDSIMASYGTDNPAKSEKVKRKISETESTNKTGKLLLRFPELKFVKMIDGLFTFVGECGHEFVINRQLLVVRDNNKHTICTECNKVDANQKSEIELYLFNELVREFPDVEVSQSVRGLVNTKHEIDIYIPSAKLGIEVNGVKYHNENYRPKNYHIDKTLLFKDAGITVVHLFDDEVVSKLTIIKSMVRSRLKRSERVHGRSCTVASIDPSSARQFFNENHMQAHANADKYLGLFYGDVLVAAMSFGKPRSFMGKWSDERPEWELIRFCNKVGVNVIGGASKLFNSFVAIHEPKSVVSYANRRWSEGNLYRTLGFLYDGVSEPGYYYFYNNKRVYRYALRKSVLAAMGGDPNKSEREITEDLGIPRIYDCGNLRFVWRAS